MPGGVLGRTDGVAFFTRRNVPSQVLWLHQMLWLRLLRFSGVWYPAQRRTVGGLDLRLAEGAARRCVPVSSGKKAPDTTGRFRPAGQ